MSNYEQTTNQYRDMINTALESYIIPTGEEYDVVKQAMLYSLSAGGKRIRPILVLEFCKVNGGDIEKALPFACAIEMIHCYSLIHDDLPCMDDDDMRRGQPSCHKKFGEANALLAGDALLTLAFETIASAWSSGMQSPQACIKAVKVLSNHAGMDGMVGGQVIDLQNEGKLISEQTLHQLHAKKTGALITAACELGAIAAEVSSDIQKKCAEYGKQLGFAFQIVDDILDVIGDEKALGKPIGSDAENQKTTFVSLYGLESAKEIAYKTTEQALQQLSEFRGNQYLIELTNKLLNRTY
ncbi:polyprenyl synthetase family protein [Paludicola sp. MB14-C6]|uniref:polyprenyl synthetase family protein n=1 Tax=Paludihabitans sp. MB14-C6 TaxID=3070656 RepID=UPI0027DE1E45|nr:farnesyl diphosphate synthase [Paludicola sp. MB14-C6]WMJ23033.1 polyprenyl synthetase family protein [Paludicola sp. MB14-C6]